MTVSSVFVIGNNLPGYMPDSEPYAITGTLDDARRALIADLLFEADYAPNEEDAEDYTAAAEDVNLWSGPDSVSVCGRVYWISQQ